MVIVSAPLHSGPLMDPPAWEEVTDFLVSVAVEIAPNAQDLITPPSTRLASVGGPSTSSSAPEIQPAGGDEPASGDASTAASAQQQQPSAASRAYSLREGVGARRLAKFRSHAAVQLLLVQGCSETYAQLHRIMPPVAALRLLQVWGVVTLQFHTPLPLLHRPV